MVLSLTPQVPFFEGSNKIDTHSYSLLIRSINLLHLSYYLSSICLKAQFVYRMFQSLLEIHSLVHHIRLHTQYIVIEHHDLGAGLDSMDTGKGKKNKDF